MKTVLFFLLTFFSLATKAQTAQNDNFKMEFVTYAQGHIVMAVQNLTQCQLEIRMKWATSDSTLFFAADELRQIMLPTKAGNVQVQAKTVAACNQQSNGPWIAISLVTLAIREQELPTKQRDPGRTQFDVFDMVGNPRLHLVGTRVQLVQKLHTLPRGVYVVKGTTVEQLANF